MLARVRLVLALALLASGVSVHADAPRDDDFIAARVAFERGDRARLDALAAGLGGHPLASYVEYWRLKLGIDTAADSEVRAFLERHAGSVLADRLAVDWQKSLAKRGQWAAFAAAFAASEDADAELACYGLQLRRQTDPEGALAAARRYWFTGQSTPQSCDVLFEAMQASGVLSLADRRARFRLAVEAGNLRLAETLGAAMPGDDRIPVRELRAVERDPARALAKGAFRWRHEAGRALALLALERSARTDAAEARAAWEKQRGHLPRDDRLHGNARLALHAARQLLPQAHAWFREAEGAPLDETQRAWRIRAALRVAAWGDVLAAVDGLPAGEARDPAWRYWKARALLATGHPAEAMERFAALAGEHHFYGLLAAEASGRGLPPSVPGDAAREVATPELLALFGSRPEVARALRLAALGLRVESQREWYYAVRHLPDSGLLVAAEYARRNGLYDRAINTAERTVALHDFGLRYLAPYRELFASAAREQDVDEAMLLGLARQESRFNPGVVSSAGATGLMQLMPPTARWIARQIGRAPFHLSEITDAALNTQFGAFYFKYWLERLERLPALAAAAYNAGPRRAQAWRAAEPLEGAVWVETIPFNETRDYVKKVLANTMFYARELEQPYIPLTARLGTIPPRGGTLMPALVRAN